MFAQDIMAHCNGSKPLAYPAYLEAECPQAVDLIRRLLVRDPIERLGAGRGGGGGGAGSYSYSHSRSCSSLKEGEEGDAAAGGGGGYKALRVRPFFVRLPAFILVLPLRSPISNFHVSRHDRPTPSSRALDGRMCSRSPRPMCPPPS